MSRILVVLFLTMIMILTTIPATLAYNLDHITSEGTNSDRQRAVGIIERGADDVQWPKPLQPAEITELDFNFIRSNVELGGESWDRIEIEDGQFTVTPGQAAVPYYVHNVITPEEIVDVKVSFGDAMTISGIDLPPAPPVYPVTHEDHFTDHEMFVYDTDYYSQNVYSPMIPYDWIKLGGTRLNGEFVWYYSIVLYPASYNPSDRMLKLNGRSTLTITYEEPEQGSAGPEASSGSKSRGTMASEPTGVKYMILTAKYLMDEMQVLANWKTQKGVPAKVFDVDDIYDNVTLTGRDDAEKLRDFVRWNYNNQGTEFVLMAGDYDKVRPRLLKDPSPYGNIDDGWISSDLYFACVDEGTTWDKDNDDDFGELGDLDDLIPDVAIGRIAINDEEIMAKKVQEFIDYEAVPPSGTWFNRATMVGTNVFTEEDGEKQCEYLRDKYMKTVYDTFTEMYEEDGTVSKEALKSAFNTGSSVMVYLGHGSSSVWTSNLGYTTLMNYPDVSALSNGNKKPVITTVSCDTSWFDAPKGNPYGDCIAESLTERIDKGAIGYLGSVRTTVGALTQSYYPYAPGLQEDFIRQINKDNLQMGKAYVDGMAHYAQSWGHLFASSSSGEEQACWEEYHLMGEPELTLWVEKPEVFTVSEKTVGNTITITVKNEQLQAVRDARVTIWLPGEIYEIRTTDSSGIAAFTISTNTDEEATLTVVKDRFVPNISKIKLLDLIPPVTGYEITPFESDGMNGWYVTPPVINFTVNEDNSVTYYRWEGGSTNEVFTTPIEAPEGESKLYYYSIDETGNTETEKYISFRLDTLVPETGFDCTPAEPDGMDSWYTSVPRIELSKEPLSTVYYHWDSHSFTEYNSPLNGPVGKHTFYYYSRDEAGHIEPTRSMKFNIDLDTPRTSIALDPQIPDGDSNWYTSNPSITLDITETNLYSTYYYWDDPGNGVETYEETIETDFEGPHTFYYYTMDEAGNIEEKKWLDIKIDSITPKTSIDVTPGTPTGEENWYKKESPVITLESSEQNANTYYYWDSENTRSIYTDPIGAPEGEHFLYFYSLDQAGNREDIHRVSFKVDTENPEVSCEVHSDTGENENGWFMELPDIDLDMDDNGVIFYYMLQEDEKLSDYSPEDLEVMKQTYVAIYPLEGNYQFYFFAVDKAGNVGDTDELTIRMDLLDPIAELDSDKVGITEGSWVQFSAGRSNDVNNIVSYRFSTGKDVISDWQESPELNYTFDDPGTYEVRVEVIDESGRISEESKPITISVKEAPKDTTAEIAEMVSGSLPLLLALIIIVVVLFVVLAVFIKNRKKRSEYYDDDDEDDDDYYSDDRLTGRGRYAEFSDRPRPPGISGRGARRLGTPPPPPPRLPPPPPPPRIVKIVKGGKTYEPEDDSGIDWDDEEESDGIDWD